MQRLAGEGQEVSVLARGLTLARAAHNGEAVTLLERSMEAYASGTHTSDSVPFPGFSQEIASFAE